MASHSQLIPDRSMRHSYSLLIAIAVASALAAWPVIAQQGVDRGKVASAPAKTQSSQRFALVIGNSAYKEAPLINPVNDANAITVALRETGFTVITKLNASMREIGMAVREFGDRLRQGGGVGLFYFAGHGMQIKGRNYLIPVGAEIAREDEVAYEAIDPQAVLDKMEAAGNGTNIMILDACRNNPFARSFRSTQQGLAQMDAPVGTLVAFATAPGSVASDGQGKNGLYTQHLLTAMSQPGAKVEDVFKQVRANVRRDSQNKQIPWESTSLEGDFYFRLALQAVAPAPVDTVLLTEQVLWDAVRDSKSAHDLRVYLNRYPNGRFARDAQVKVSALEEVTTVSAAPTPAHVFVPVVATPKPSVAAPAKLATVSKPIATTPPVVTTTQQGAAPAKPASRSNSFGYSVGDRYRTQRVDKYKGEVIGNMAFTIGEILENGDLVSKDKSIILKANGSPQLIRYANGETHEWSESYEAVPAPDKLKVGYKQDIGWTYRYKGSGGGGEEVHKGEMKVLGIEKVTVPAGEFETFKILRVTYYSSSLPQSSYYSSSKNTGSCKETVWFAPSIGAVVIREVEVKGPDILMQADIYREELTSYEVAKERLALK